MKRNRGQSTMEMVALITVVLIGLIAVLNGPFKSAMDKTFNSAANAVANVGDQLDAQIK